MFKRKYRAALISENGDYVRCVDYRIEGPKRLRVVIGGDFVLNEDGTILGSTLFARWEQL